MVVFRDVAIALPKLYVVTINELPGVFFRGVIVGADEFDGPEKTAVRTDDIGSIFCHLQCAILHTIAGGLFTCEPKAPIPSDFT
jgi:hypothetical protein